MNTMSFAAITGTFGGCILALVLSCDSEQGYTYKDITYKLNKIEERGRSKREKVLTTWLRQQEKGRKGSQFWVEDWFVNPVRFYALRSWEIVDYQSGSFTVRISPSNSGGVPIRKLWKIHVAADYYHSYPNPLESEGAMSKWRKVMLDSPKIMSVEPAIEE